MTTALLLVMNCGGDGNEGGGMVGANDHDAGNVTLEVRVVKGGR